MDFDHERHECQVEDDAEEAENEVAVEHEDALVLPWVLALQVDAVEDVFEKCAYDCHKQYGILKINNGTL